MSLYIQLLKTLGIIAAFMYALRFLISILSKERSVYAPDASRHFFMLFWALLCLLIAGPLVIFYFTKPFLNPLEASLLLVIGLVLSSFALPAFAVHIQYFFNDFQKLVEIDKKNQTFKIYDIRKKLFYRKEDIVRLTRVQCKSAKFFWSNYEYVTFELSNGSEVRITSLLMPLDKIIKYVPTSKMLVNHKTICFI